MRQRALPSGRVVAEGAPGLTIIGARSRGRLPRRRCGCCCCCRSCGQRTTRPSPPAKPRGEVVEV
eukprot:scaffold3096_cov403-Prasinococcus_capsulatus_cf.AAC.19